MATLSFNDGQFEYRCTNQTYQPAKEGGWRFCPTKNWIDPHWFSGYFEKVGMLIDRCRQENIALKIEDSAHEEIRRIEKEREEKLEKSWSTESKLEIPVPDGLEYYPFQRAGIEYALNNKNTLIGDEMGLGKTIQAIGVINYLKPKKVLIIVPASLKLNWKTELRKWLVDAYSATVVEEEKDFESDIAITNFDRLTKHMKHYLSLVKDERIGGKKTDKKECTICNKTFVKENSAYDHIDREHPDEITDKILKTDYDLLIIDESHYVKNYKAQRTQSVIRIAKKVKHKIFLTGTPIMNRPIELFTPLCILNSDITRRGWTNFVTRYCAGKRGYWGWEVGGASNLDELNEKLRGSVMVRRLKKDVLTELPSKTRSLVLIEAVGSEIKTALTREKGVYGKWNAVKEELAEMKERVETTDDSESELEFRDQVKRLRSEAKEAFTEIAIVRHETALAKVPEAVEFIRGALETQDKLVVFTHHKDVLRNICDKFQNIAVEYHGDISLESRNSAIENFQNNEKVRLLVGTIPTAGIGVTLTAASVAIFVELEWTPSAMNQAEDRLHRIGQENAVNIYHLVIDGSIDSELAKILIHKQEIIDTVLDDKIEIEKLNLSDVEDLSKTEASKTLDKIAQRLSEENANQAHRLLQHLALRCDGALSEDDMGFNKTDTLVGKSLAASTLLSKRQAALGYVVLRKYCNQIGELKDYKKLYEKEKQ